MPPTAPQKIEEGKEHKEGRGGKGINSEEEVVEVELEDATREEELANADELNRKFEKFIRKTKEEIKIEAQTP
ncbi:hypothetical protein HN873_012839, partial [Arachis hypogaea]